MYTSEKVVPTKSERHEMMLIPDKRPEKIPSSLHTLRYLDLSPQVVLRTGYLNRYEGHSKSSKHLLERGGLGK